MIMVVSALGWPKWPWARAEKAGDRGAATVHRSPGKWQPRAPHLPRITQGVFRDRGNGLPGAEVPQQGGRPA